MKKTYLIIFSLLIISGVSFLLISGLRGEFNLTKFSGNKEQSEQGIEEKGEPDKEVIIEDELAREFTVCSDDIECIAKPSCHPTECINSNFKERFNEPSECSDIFNPKAVYDNEDCLCQEGFCVNSNQDRPVME